LAPPDPPGSGVQTGRVSGRLTGGQIGGVGVLVDQ
jgi:hypothetical protein